MTAPRSSGGGDAMTGGNDGSVALPKTGPNKDGGPAPLNNTNLHVHERPETTGDHRTRLRGRHDDSTDHEEKKDGDFHHLSSGFEDVSNAAPVASRTRRGDSNTFKSRPHEHEEELGGDCGPAGAVRGAANVAGDRSNKPGEEQLSKTSKNSSEATNLISPDQQILTGANAGASKNTSSQAARGNEDVSAEGTDGFSNKKDDDRRHFQPPQLPITPIPTNHRQQHQQRKPQEQHQPGYGGPGPDHHYMYGPPPMYNPYAMYPPPPYPYYPPPPPNAGYPYHPPPYPPHPSYMMPPPLPPGHDHADARYPPHYPPGPYQPPPPPPPPPPLASPRRSPNGDQKNSGSNPGETAGVPPPPPGASPFYPYPPASPVVSPDAAAAAAAAPMGPNPDYPAYPGAAYNGVYGEYGGDGKMIGSFPYSPSNYLPPAVGNNDNDDKGEGTKDSYVGDINGGTVGNHASVAGTEKDTRGSYSFDFAGGFQGVGAGREHLKDTSEISENLSDDLDHGSTSVDPASNALDSDAPTNPRIRIYVKPSGHASQDVLLRRERKNRQSRSRAAKHRERMIEIETKPKEQRTEEEQVLWEQYQTRRQRKNNRSRERAKEKKEEIDRILSIPEEKRTKIENAFLNTALGAKKRKNEGDRARRTRLKETGSRGGDSVNTAPNNQGLPPVDYLVGANTHGGFAMPPSMPPPPPGYPGHHPHHPPPYHHHGQPIMAPPHPSQHEQQHFVPTSHPFGDEPHSPGPIF